MLAVAVVAYSVVAVLALRPVAGHLAWARMYAAKRSWPSTLRNVKEPRWCDWALGLTAALAVCAAWPLAVLWRLAGRLAGRLPKIGYERDAEIAALKARIEAAERELGVSS